MSFNTNWPDNHSTDDERPAKTRRIARACLQVSATNLTRRYKYLHVHFSVGRENNDVCHHPKNTIYNYHASDVKD